MRVYLFRGFFAAFLAGRYYGFFAPGNRRLLAQVRSLLGASAKLVAPSEPISTALPVQPTPTCPHCGQPLRWVETLPRRRSIRAPPG